MANNRELYDRTISLKILFKKPGTDDTTEFAIDCPSTGIKPNIKVHWKRVSGDFSYDAEIYITNLYLPLPSIYAEEIEIKAGYRGDYEVFTFTVFSSYQASPGPDGETVFLCIVGSAGKTLYGTQPYTFALYNGTKPYTVGEVLNETAAQIQRKSGKPFAIKFYPEEGKNEYLDDTFSTSDIELFTVMTGYQLLNKIQLLLNTKYKSQGVQVTTVYFNSVCVFAFIDKSTNTIRISNATSIKDSAYSSEEIPVLDAVSEVDWNAGTLSVVAPFNPKIYPACLFKIEVNYYKGGIGLPKEVARLERQRDRFDVYWVITQEVTFGTTDTNTMKLLAIPMSLSPAANQRSSYIKQQDVGEQTKREFTQKLIVPIEIKLGERSKAEEQADSNVKDVSDLVIQLPTSQTKQYVIKEDKPASDPSYRETLSTIAQREGLPDLEGHANGETANVKVASHIAWYPIIMVLTNSQYKSNKGMSNGNLWKIDMKNPDRLTTGNYLQIPVGVTWKQLQENSSMKPKIVNCFKVCAEYYEKLKLSSWASNLSLAAKIFEEYELK